MNSATQKKKPTKLLKSSKKASFAKWIKRHFNKLSRKIKSLKIMT